MRKKDFRFILFNYGKQKSFMAINAHVLLYPV